MRQPVAEFALRPWGRNVKVTRKLGPRAGGPGKARVELLLIETECANSDELVYIGSGKGTEAEEDLLPILLGHGENWGNPDRSTLEPHIRFANAGTDEALMEFLKDYGPVLVRGGDPKVICPPAPGGTTKPEGTSRTIAPGKAGGRLGAGGVLPAEGPEDIDVDPWPRVGLPAAAIEILAKLRAEQRWFAALLRLVGLVKEREFDSDALCKAFLSLEELEEGMGVSRVMFDSTRLLEGKDVSGPTLRRLVMLDLLEFLKGYRFEHQIVEHPDGRPPRAIPLPSREGRVFREILLGLLLMELEGPAEVRTCPNRKCRQVFKPDRLNQTYCGKKCADRAASAKYYEARGKVRKKEKEGPASTARKHVPSIEPGRRKALRTP